MEPVNKELYSESNLSLQLNDVVELHLNKIKTSDFYRLLCTKLNTALTELGQRNGDLNEDSWKRIFTSLKNACREAKLKEFQFKLIHRVIVTKQELY